MSFEMLSPLLANLQPDPRLCAPGLRGGVCAINGEAVYVAATDPSRARGAIGVAEARALSELLRQARSAQGLVVLLLDSAGARVDEGLPALGAFRLLLREIVLSRLAGVPMLAVLGRSCFGGASLLACCCTRRIFAPDSRLGASGPAIIEAFEGKTRFDASDRQQVTALFGAQSRQRILIDDEIVDPVQLPARVHAWLASARDDLNWNASAEHARLESRLRSAGLLDDLIALAPDRQQAVMTLLPNGYVPTFSGGIVWAEPAASVTKPVFAGCVSGATLTARDCWALADRLRALPERLPNCPVVLLLDAQSHAASLADERVLLSSYLVHLSLVIAQLAQRGHRMVLWLPGAASGAAYVTFAAPVEQVAVLASAQVDILPPAAQQQIIGETVARTSDIQMLIAAQVADRALDSRLEAYSRARPS